MYRQFQVYSGYLSAPKTGLAQQPEAHELVHHIGKPSFRYEGVSTYCVCLSPSATQTNGNGFGEKSTFGTQTATE